MSKSYAVTFWEKESVWVRRRVDITTDKPKEEIENIVKDGDIYKYSTEVYPGDYHWDTSETLEYDIDDLEIEELH